MIARFVSAFLMATLFLVCEVKAVDWQALPNEVPCPKDNPQTLEKIELGKKLFFDPRLSLTGTVSCNSCHNVMEGGDDDRPTSMGIEGRLGPRNAPTVWNSVFQTSQFWDGRAASLEEQAKGPLIAAPEMGMSGHDAVIDRIAEIPGYQVEFKKVFGNEEPITIDHVAMAIAAFERTLITPDSPYDKYVKGDKKALNPQQLQGMQLFASVGCADCHAGPAFNGWDAKSTQPEFEQFPVYGKHALVKQYELAEDLGRFQITQKEEDKHRFKVATLRNISLTAPYLHHGKVPTLEEAVNVMSVTQLDKTFSQQETDSLVAFLESLEGQFPSIEFPRLPAKSGTTVVPADASKQSK